MIRRLFSTPEGIAGTAILVLLGFLFIMNAAAIFLRQRFERRW